MKQNKYDSEGHLVGIDVWDWIVTTSGDVRQITHDDMNDLHFSQIERFATEIEIENEKNTLRSCPFDSHDLINVGTLKDFDDDNDNLCCPKCKRIWYSCGFGEFASRVRRVNLLKIPEIGDNIDDVIQVI